MSSLRRRCTNTKNALQRPSIWATAVEVAFIELIECILKEMVDGFWRDATLEMGRVLVCSLAGRL